MSSLDESRIVCHCFHSTSVRPACGQALLDSLQSVRDIGVYTGVGGPCTDLEAVMSLKSQTKKKNKNLIN